jgi:divalent metal cation (Fe/Co/Zn/Cd) transporter
MNQKQVERKSLILSSFINLIITGAGIWVFAVTQIQALFLDCFFSFIGLVSSILAVVISKVSKKRTRLYPDGIYFLEPLYAILKSVLTLGLLAVSVVATSEVAYQYFAFGIGETMNIEPVLPYTISMVVLCFGLSFYNNAQNKKINNISTILTAEAKSNFIDGLQSLGIGLAIIILYFIDANGALGFLHYTGDFFVTVILSIVSLKQPIKVLISSFRELSGGASDDAHVRNNVGKVIATYFDAISPNKHCTIFKIGMYINVRITLRDEIDKDFMNDLMLKRQSALNELKKIYDNIEISFIF